MSEIINLVSRQVEWWYIQCNLQVVSSNSFNANILGSIPSIKCLGIYTNLTSVLYKHMVSCMWSDMIDTAEISICRQESGYSRRFRSDRDGHRKHTAVKCEGSCWSHSGSGGKIHFDCGFQFLICMYFLGPYCAVQTTELERSCDDTMLEDSEIKTYWQ